MRINMAGQILASGNGCWGSPGPLAVADRVSWLGKEAVLSGLGLIASAAAALFAEFYSSYPSTCLIQMAVDRPEPYGPKAHADVPSLDRRSLLFLR